MNTEYAFPVKDESHGLTIRDYFAAKAMQSLIVAHPDDGRDNIALRAYRYADEMVMGREPGFLLVCDRPDEEV